ncbi:hypothetical protein NQ315_011525 [Exocentrus adspersus]|uniref:Uncharacterized protein n=1 Tax=Exocentrus adspersus TaxID=1586481 RepID=A0AAV8VUW1_9CUCU|nr:hypothetical protein NQ315_011525 [Exocentrus adspersus]
MIKLCLTFAAALLVLSPQIYSQDNVPIVKNEVKDLLKKLQEVVNGYLVEANNTLNAAEAKVNEAAASVESKAEAAMKSTEDKFKEELDELKKKASDAGVNIDECLGKNEEDLVNMPNQLSNDMVHCVSDRIIEGISYAQDVLNKIQATVNEVANMEQEIKDCGGGLKSVKCLAKLAIKIEEDIVALPKQITDDVDKAVSLIEEIDTRIEDCASDKVDKLESDGGKLLLTISECVAKKLITG